MTNALYVAGVSGSALQFDGSSSWVRVASTDDLQTPTFSVALWAWSDTALAVPDRGLCGKHREHDNISYYWLYQSGADVRGTMAGGTYSDNRHATANAAPLAAGWTHLALTYDGLQMRLHVNGTEVASNEVTGHVGNHHDLLIGAGEWSWFTGRPQRHWLGRIDEVRVYNRALAAAEIVALAGGVTNEPPPPGAVRVDLGPAGAVDAGARWRLAHETPGSWHGSGDVLEALPPGAYDLVCGPAPGWITPAARAVSVQAGSTQTVAITYVTEPADGLVLRYDFEQIAAGHLADLSGLAHSGQVFGASLQSGGPFGSYGRFNGSNDYVRVRHTAALGTSNFSAAAWIMTEEVGPALDRGILGKHRAFDDLSYYWLYQHDGLLRGTMIGDQYGQYRFVDASIAPAVFNWAHVALTYDGAVQRLYLNGVEAAATNVSGYRSNGYDLLVGAGEWGWGGSPQRWWRGGLDELRLYNRALSAVEVSALYAGLTNPVSPRGSLRVQIEPAGAAAAGAWRLASEPTGTWHASGTVLTNLPAGLHPLVFQPALGWAQPEGLSAAVLGSALSTVTGRYAYVSTNDLVLYFDFDEAPTNGVLADKSGYGNHGRATNVVFTAGGQRGGAYFFNGSNAFVVIPDDSSYDKTSFSISVWGWSTATNVPSDLGLLGKHRAFDDTSYYWMYVGSSNSYGSNVIQSTMIGSTFGAYQHISASAAPVMGQWAHLALTYQAPTMRFYLNGQLINTRTVNGYNGNGYDLLVGAGEWSSGGPMVPQRLWRGYLDEVRIYRRALAGSEVYDLAHVDVSSDVIPPVIVDVHPPNRHVTTESKVTMTIRAEDNVAVTEVRVNGLPAEPRGDEKWKFQADGLEMGTNVFTITARDEQGNVVTQVVEYARGRKLKLGAEADGQWLVANPNEQAMHFEWEVLGGTEAGTGVVEAAGTAGFETSVGPKAVQLTASGYLQDTRSWNPEPVVGYGLVETNAGPQPGRMLRNFGGAAIMTWASVPGQSYQVQRAQDLAGQVWVTVPGGTYVGDGSVITHTNQLTSGPDIFRLQVGDINW